MYTFSPIDTLLAYRAITAPKTANSPAAKEATFLTPAPVKACVPGEPAAPVPDGGAGEIGDPVAAGPDPAPPAPPAPPVWLAPPDGIAAVPVAMGFDAVTKPVEPAGIEVLWDPSEQLQSITEV